MVMASTSTTSRGNMTSDSEMSNLQGIEALKLRVGPARRNLFGPVDHQQLQQEFQQLLRMSVEVANKRWNFDFQRDMPGEGASVEWEGLRCQDVPAFYRTCLVKPRVTARRNVRSNSLSSDEDSSPVSSSSSGSGDEYLEVTTRGRYQLERLEKRKQSAITDFFKVKKRKLLHCKTSSRQ
ncbi:PREDICTED: cyclin-dependent kinase inhibitor 1-like [Cyprinodon variegatus]|uniref:Cyclin-dependent kinase inhibitor 1-like n=1 Tax=Cyprinodon variegatus TaxID=28743 RepID=A0A3Q2CVL0_CYPVA|nr:PREDICTED: cyclin-dependent kinase inhibitor 1-like [Cyprinodon variegatus]XP_015253222.1 PREDICTED: cyclin-dependent kinase inhibitor 1-like [Cyprinodon variegatus]